MSTVFSRFKSVIEEKNINTIVLWDKINDIITKRDEEDLGISFDDMDIINHQEIGEDGFTEDNFVPSLEEILNQLIILDLTTNPDDYSILKDQLETRGLGFLVDFLNDLSDSEVLDYINEDYSFEAQSNIKMESDFEVEIIDFLVSNNIRRAEITLPDYLKECTLTIYENEGCLYIVMGGVVTDFKNQDEELQQAILLELRSGDYIQLD